MISIREHESIQTQLVATTPIASPAVASTFEIRKEHHEKKLPD
jgi:hypothetical protein